MSLIHYTVYFNSPVCILQFLLRMSLLSSPLLELSLMLATMWLWTVRLVLREGSQTVMWQWAARGPKMVQHSLVSVVVSLSQTSKGLLAETSSDSWCSLPWALQWTMAHMHVWSLSLQYNHSLLLQWWGQGWDHLLFKVRLEDMQHYTCRVIQKVSNFNCPAAFKLPCSRFLSQEKTSANCLNPLHVDVTWTTGD